jgi:Tol biopolymer transport system component
VPAEGIWITDFAKRKQLTSSAEWADWSPRWSRNGEWILFIRSGPESDDGSYEEQLWMLRPDGTGLRMAADMTSSDIESYRRDYRYDWWTPQR